MPGALDYGKYNKGQSKTRGTITDDLIKRRKELEKLSSRSPQEKKIARLKMASKLITGIKRYYNSYYDVGNQIGDKITRLIPTKVDDALSNFAGEAARVRNDLYDQLFNHVLSKVNDELNLTRKGNNIYGQNKEQETQDTQERQSTKGDYP